VTKWAAGASEARVAQAAREALSWGNAVDAVVAGVLVAAADSPTVLLGPLQMLIGGAGAGLLAVDGRVRQPGLGAPRPRGVLAGHAVPPQARVGVPALPSALAAALASAGSTTLARALRPAIEVARAASPERARVLQVLAKQGGIALANEAVAGELMAHAGRASGGALTRDDLEAVRPAVVSCDELRLPNGAFVVPWRTQSADASETHVVAAADGRGLVAVACYEAPIEGLAVPHLGLVAPPSAAPVMRGETRVPPGEVRPSAAPIALRAGGGVVDLALGVACSPEGEALLTAVLAALDAQILSEALGAAASARTVAVVRTRDAAIVVASA
jgi:hypothetical protein